jgi:hypothetical protein
MNALLTLALLSSLGFPVDTAKKVDWNPAQTHVVIAGVLQWENNVLSGFSTHHRKDKELSEVLLKRGVPTENLTLLLDAQATRQKTLEALIAQAKKAKPGSTFLFYYCGHGWRGSSGVALANYDYRPDNQLTVKEIGETLATHFPGKRVIFLADCCHSGGLKTAGDILGKKGKEVIVLTSADSSNVSTGNWTFTQTIIDALHGDPLMDHNGDGVITLKELADEVAAAMRYRERQRYGYATYGITTEYRVVTVDVTRPHPPVTKGIYAIGEYVLAFESGRLRPARIINWSSGKYVVEFYHYSDKSQLAVPPIQLRKITPKTYPEGTNLVVLWEDKPYAAKVLKVEQGFHLITYPGWSTDWDEWILADRILGEYKLKGQPQLFEVEWREQWYPAVALAEKEGKHYIRYLGFEESWNEWVPPERMRKPKAK